MSTQLDLPGHTPVMFGISSCPLLAVLFNCTFLSLPILPFSPSPSFVPSLVSLPLLPSTHSSVMNNNDRDDSPDTIGRGEMSTEVTSQFALANTPSALGRPADSVIRHEEELHREEQNLMFPYAQLMSMFHNKGRQVPSPCLPGSVSGPRYLKTGTPLTGRWNLSRWLLEDSMRPTSVLVISSMTNVLSFPSSLPSHFPFLSLPRIPSFPTLTLLL